MVLAEEFEKGGVGKDAAPTLAYSRCAGSEDGFGGRQRRISVSRLLSSSTSDTGPAGCTEWRSLLPSTHDGLVMRSTLSRKENVINRLVSPMI